METALYQRGMGQLRQILMLGLSLALPAPTLAARPDCRELMQAALEDLPQRLLAIPADAGGPRSRAPHHRDAVLWHLPGARTPADLIPRLEKLFDQVIAQSLEHSVTHRGLLDQWPDYREYLNAQKQQIALLLEAWTNPATGNVELANYSLLTSQRAQSLAQRLHNQSLQLRPAILVESENLILKNRWVIPPTKIAGLPLSWTVRLVPDAAQGVRVVLEPHPERDLLSAGHAEIPGEARLIAFAGLSSHFGAAPTRVPRFHQYWHSSMMSKRGPGIPPLRVESLVEIWKTLATQSGGRFAAKSFLSRLQNQFNLQMMHTFCRNSDLCGELSADFLSDARESLGPNWEGFFVREPSGAYLYANNLAGFNRVFEAFAEKRRSVSETDHRLMGWEGLMGFAKRSFASYEDAAWQALLKRFKLTANFYQGSKLSLSVDVKVRPYLGASDFWAGRVDLLPIALQLDYNFLYFENQARVEDLQIKSFVLGLEPSLGAFRQGDLTPEHMGLLLSQLDHLLANAATPR